MTDLIDTADEIVKWLRDGRNENNIAGMSRFAISGGDIMGIPVPVLRAKARTYPKNSDLARQIWNSGIHEARIMASMIACHDTFTPEDMDCWCAAFDSWDVCDQCCLNLFRKLPFAVSKIESYAADDREFVRRCAFALMAAIAVHAGADDDIDFARWLEIITIHAADKRNFVKKAVNWALRQIGKRNLILNSMAADTARKLSQSSDPAERWIGRNALNELTARRTLDFIMSHREHRFGADSSCVK